MIDAPTEIHLASNLKREKERTIARYLESFLSHIRDPQGGTSQQNDPGKGMSETFPTKILHIYITVLYFYGNRKVKNYKFLQLNQRQDI